MKRRWNEEVMLAETRWRERKRNTKRDRTKSGPVGILARIAELRGLIVLYRLGGPEGETRGFVPSNLPLVIHHVMIRF